MQRSSDRQYENSKRCDHVVIEAATINTDTWMKKGVNIGANVEISRLGVLSRRSFPYLSQFRPTNSFSRRCNRRKNRKYVKHARRSLYQWIVNDFRGWKRRRSILLIRRYRRIVFIHWFAFLFARLFIMQWRHFAESNIPDSISVLFSGICLPSNIFVIIKYRVVDDRMIL